MTSASQNETWHTMTSASDYCLTKESAYPDQGGLLHSTALFLVPCLQQGPELGAYQHVAGPLPPDGATGKMQQVHRPGAQHTELGPHP